jgi:exopolysaccharide biosynthesis protein
MPILNKLTRVFIFIFWLSACASVPQYRNISSGLYYERIEINNEIAHLLTLDLRLVKLELKKAKNPSLQPSSMLAPKNALAAINAGFFTKEGNAAGALKIDKTWYSYPVQNRGVFGWNKSGEVFFDRLRKSSDPNERIASDFSKKSWWHEAENIVGGAPLLLFNQEIVDPAPEKTLESFLKEKYARTAVCIDKDLKLKFVVLNGGDSKTGKIGFSGGMSINELAHFMKSLDCVHALNLDGGYSSTLIIDGKMINKFSLPLSPERPVATAFLIFENNALGITPNGK